MATTDMNAVVRVMDSNGNINSIYPNTKIANVDGLQTALNAKASANSMNPSVDRISGTTIQSYVNDLAVGVYHKFYTTSNTPSDAPVIDNCFVDIYVYSNYTALIVVYPTGTTYYNTTYKKVKVNGSYQNWVKHINTAISPSHTALTKDSGVSSKITVNDGGYVNINGLVNVTARFTVSSDIAAGSALFSNLPAIESTYTSAGYAVAPVNITAVGNVDTSGLKVFVTSANSGGTSKIEVGANSSTLKAGTYCIGITYLARS